MPRRTIAVLGAVVAVVLVLHFGNSKKQNHPQPSSTISTTAIKPQPAASPTAAVSTPTSQTTTTKPRSKSPAKADNEDGSSNIKPVLKAKLVRLVELYASWPGVVSRQVLTRKLEQQQPFITSDAIRKIKAQWSSAPQTLQLSIKGVVSESNLYASSQDSNSAIATVYLMLVRHFKPVSGKPYNQTATQPYTVDLKIINRRWTVVGITPQVASLSSDSSS